MRSFAPLRRRRAVIAGVAVTCLAFPAASSAAAATLPDPCTLLAKVHPERTLHKGGSAIKHRQHHKYGAGATASATCSETIGTQPVSLSLSFSGGGFGGVKITSMTHPSGLGAGATLVVGTGAGSGGPVDFISFHKKTIFADINANGAAASGLTTVARQVFKLLP
jgi:hypothetical protein